uniref:Uncharacterized protein n=1 Tax=Gossypium raimondii TaxID=29730 RepID=A0A0D2S1L6_GOSRA|nr:hypothetical protein B456_004G179500 [Gossypium raimondii]
MVMGPQSVVMYLRLLLQRPWLAIMRFDWFWGWGCMRLFLKVILSWRSARSYLLIMICRPLGLTSKVSMQWLCSFVGVDSCMFPELQIRWPICW